MTGLLNTIIACNATKHVVQNINGIVSTNGASLVFLEPFFTTKADRWVLQDRDGQEWKTSLFRHASMKFGHISDTEDVN